MSLLKVVCAWCSDWLSGPDHALLVSHGICGHCCDAVAFAAEPCWSDPIWGGWIDLGGEG